jgi:hypothetical protein
MNPEVQPKNGDKTRSKYELTLAEFPVFLLSKKGHEDIEVIEYQDTITGKEGQIVNRVWKVYPHSKFGLGTESTFETLFELFQIWKEDHFNTQYIRFGSIFNLLKRKSKGSGAKEYKRIVRDLNCLVGITIEAKNAFWDNEARAYVNMTFHLFDQLKIFKIGGTGAIINLSWIKASDILYGSILKNSLVITSFDSRFFQSLTPMEQRLSLYLSKILRSQSVHRREISEFARQLPIYAKKSYHVKQQLKRGCSGLIEKGFEPLNSFSFEKAADGSTEYIVFKANGNGNTPAKPKFPGPEQRQKQLLPPVNAPVDLEYLTDTILEFCGDRKSLNFYKKVARIVPRNIIFRALSEAKVSYDLAETKKSKAAHFTYLVRRYAGEQGVKL